jgi:DNA polymerase
MRQDGASPLPSAPTQDLSKIESLEELCLAMAAIEGLAIKKTAMNMVFGEGPLHPPLMFIGEAPGEEEDRSGRPLVGRAGQLLDKMLASIGISREQVYITNVLRWRPPGNRTPKSDEVAACLPYLLRHIELVAPKLLVLLGGPAAKAVLGRDESVTRLRNQWHTHPMRRIQAATITLKDEPSAGSDQSVLLPTLVSYHPAYLLRTPLQKQESWRDFRVLIKKLGSVESR